MNILKNYKRKLALRSITGNMGRVVEDEDEMLEDMDFEDSFDE